MLNVKPSMEIKPLMSGLKSLKVDHSATNGCWKLIIKLDINDLYTSYNRDESNHVPHGKKQSKRARFPMPTCTCIFLPIVPPRVVYNRSRFSLKYKTIVSITT